MAHKKAGNTKKGKMQYEDPEEHMNSAMMRGKKKSTQKPKKK